MEYKINMDLHNKGAVALMNTDGWQNVMTGVGLKQFDRKENAKFYMDDILSWQELSDMYRGDGIGKKIIDIPVKDMLRVGFTVEGDTDHAIPKYLDNLGFYPALRDALKWARLYGGSLMILGVDDGDKPENLKVLETPLDEESVKKVSFFRVYDRRQVQWWPTDVETDPTSPNYGNPAFYTVFPLTSGATVFPQFKVHHTRCWKFKGTPLPERESLQQLGWGDSVLQSVYTRVRGFCGAMTDTEDILSEFIIGVMEIGNLQELVSAGNEQALINRLNQVDMSKRIMNTMLVDKEEKYTRISATVNGIKDILEFFKDTLSAVSGIPQVKLFGEQAQGLGSEAAGNIRLYYDDIADQQVEELMPVCRRVTSLVLKSTDFAQKKPELAKQDHITITFPTLWQMSAVDLSKAHAEQAKADDLYVQNGTLTGEEVAKSRFGNKTYSMETVLIETDRKGIVPPVVVAKKKGDEDVQDNPDRGAAAGGKGRAGKVSAK